jgi:hypothetical protein
MATYHINIRTDSHVAGATEFEAETLTGLRLEMARYVGEVLKDHAEQLWADEVWQIDVTDAAGLILYVIRVDASETSATAGSVQRDNPSGLRTT